MAPLIGSSGTGLGNTLTGQDSVLTAGEQLAGAGGGSIPSGVGALVWEFVDAQFLPSDNLDARSCSVVGALVDGILYTSGVVNLPFTTEGGQPTVGQTVWLASSQDDANTGRGKATATQPSTAQPVFPLFTQNIVPIGVCTNNSHYGVDGTCQVHLAVPAHPQYVVPSDQTFTSRRMTGTDPSNLMQVGVPSGTDERNWRDGESIVVAFTVDTFSSPTSNPFVVGALDAGATDGWGIGGDSSILCYGQFSAGGANLGPPMPGLNIVAATKTGGLVRASMNGGDVQTVSFGAVTPTVLKFAAGDGWNRGGQCNFVKLNRVIVDADLQAFSNNQLGTPRNYFAPRSTLTTDPNCQWFVDFSTWTGGALSAQAGPAGTTFAFTVVGAPVSSSVTYKWDRNPRALFLDGPLPSYDTRYLSRDRQLQRIAFTVNNLLELSLLTVGLSLDDTDNADEAAGAFIVNGQVVSIFEPNADSVILFESLMPQTADPLLTFAAIPPPWHVEMVVGDKITRIDTFDSGQSFSSLVYPTSAVFDTAATTKRLVVVADGETYGGHSASGGVGRGAVGSCAVVQRVRADYPGRVSGFGCQATQSMFAVLNWGNGSAAPYAKYVADNGHEGSPLNVIYLVALGFTDWFQQLITVGQFAIGIGQFVDALHAADPTAAIAVAKPVQTALYSSPNLNGDTLQEFADAVGGLTATRPWLTLVDLTTPNTITFTGGTGSPAINPAFPAGQVALKSNIKAAPVVGYP